MARSLILGHHVSSRSNVISGSASPGRRSPYRSASIKMTMKDCHESSRDGAVRISRQCVSMSEDTRSPRIQLKGYDESWICAGFPLEAIEHTALFGWREVAGVAVE